MEYPYELLKARDFFAEGKYEHALEELNWIPESERNAPWYAFRAEIEDKLERYYDALRSLQLATELEPKNKVYKERLKEYRQKLKDLTDPPKEKADRKRTILSICGELGAELCCAGTCECLCEGLSGCG